VGLGTEEEENGRVWVHPSAMNTERPSLCPPLLCTSPLPPLSFAPPLHWPPARPATRA